MIERDFTLKKYTELCEAIVSSFYVPLTIQEFLNQMILEDGWLNWYGRTLRI